MVKQLAIFRLVKTETFLLKLPKVNFSNLLHVLLDFWTDI